MLLSEKVLSKMKMHDIQDRQYLCAKKKEKKEKSWIEGEDFKAKYFFGFDQKKKDKKIKRQFISLGI